MTPTTKPAAGIGDDINAIDTPALVIDLDALERNVARMAAFAGEHGMRLRPHAKTHKSGHVAALQRRAGAVGVCVQKLSEACALADAGVDDIYISNEVLAPRKLAELAELARRVKLSVAVDSQAGIDALGEALTASKARVDVYVEIDVGQARCGAAPADAGRLAQRVAAHACMRFAGLQAYHGKAQHLRDVRERQAAIRHAVAQAAAAVAAVKAAGLECPLVTGAGSGSFPFEATSGVYGELQAGSYVFMDRDYADNAPIPGVPVFEHALFIKSQVISRDAAHAVVDAGHKSHAIDSGLPRVWNADLEFVNGGDEHGILLPRADALPALAATVWLVPGHCDPTVNLHDHYIVVRGGLVAGRVVDVWPVHARGCIR